MAVDGPTYDASIAGSPLRQGEILSSVEQYIVRASTQGADHPVDAKRKLHPFAVVLAQDCDLAQDFAGRQNEIQVRLLIPNIMMCELDLAESLKGDTDRIAKGPDIWKRIIQNKDDRFQYLRAIAPEFDALAQGIAALLADFKRTFTLPTDGLHEQLQRVTKRRAVLMSPYREHLSFRHAHFISRVALPLDHHS